MKLLIAEKPSVALSLAKVIGASQQRDGFYAGNDYIVSWCFGHLTQQAQPDFYNKDWKTWRLEHLPIFVENTSLVANNEERSKHQTEILTSLFNDKFEYVINACDAGREGELIFRNIYEFAKSSIPIKRIWFASMTDEALKSAFSNLKDGSEYDNLANAARARAHADWLIGINGTRALTLTAQKQNQDVLFTIGRVQTPVLSLIVKRDLERSAFKKSISYLPHLTVASKELGSVPFEMDMQTDEKLTKEKAEEILKSLKKELIVSSFIQKEEKTSPPDLFDLTSLQRAANVVHGLSAANTLALAQQLYEKKMITYPRTDSQFLSSDMAATLPSLLSQLTTEITTPIRPHCINDKKISDHHAIIPTGQITGDLSPDETKLYDMIVKRFIANHLESEISQQTTIIASDGTYSFEAKGRVILNPGWNAIEKQKRKENQLPSLFEGETLTITEITAKEVKTSPPKAYTESSLLKAMENVANTLNSDTEEEKKILKDVSGIGTPATRAGIIETLINRQFISRAEKSILSTPLGRQLILSIPPNSTLTSPLLTANWELALRDIEEGKLKREDFTTNLRNQVYDTVEQLKKTTVDTTQNSVPRKPQESNSASLGNCPKCKSPLITRKTFLACPDRDTCGFTFSKTISGKTLTPTDLTSLFTKGKTKTLDGFISKKGSKYSASLSFDEGKLCFSFDKPKTPAKKGGK